MPIFGTRVRRLFALRHTAKTLDRIAAALEQQNQLLTRLCDRFTPQLPAAADLASTGPSYARDTEQAAILDFIQQQLRNTGREPTEDEILEFLDEIKSGTTH